MTSKVIGIYFTNRTDEDLFVMDARIKAHRTLFLSNEYLDRKFSGDKRFFDDCLESLQYRISEGKITYRVVESASPELHHHWQREGF